MRFNIFLFLLLFTGITKGQHSNPFLQLNYDNVIMYDFEPDKPESNIINSDGKLAHKIYRKVTLSQTDISTLNKKFADSNSFGGGTRDCYLPHLGIIYYLKKLPVAQINICFDCNRIFSNIPLLGKKYGKVYRGATSYYLRDDGMSKEFKYFLTTLLIKHNFSIHYRNTKS